MPEPVKVLIVVDHLGTGGAQEYIRQLCQHLSPDRVQLSVCTLHSAGMHQERLEGLGTPVYVLAPTSSLIHLPRMIVHLLRLLRSQQYDVVHTFLQGSLAIGTPMARLMQIPTIHSIMADRIQLQGWMFPLMAWYQRWVTLYLGVDLEQLKDAGIQDNKIKLVEMPVDLTAALSVEHDTEQVIRPFDLVGAYPVALSVGRLHPDKGHEYAIRAWQHVLEDWPSARLLVVGDGEDELRLRSLVEQLGLAGTVLFTGYRSNLAALFTRADLFLRPSVNEGVNMVTVQAMAAGLPVVGFQTHARKDFVVHDISGWLCPLGDELALARAIEQLGSEPDLRCRLGQRARAGTRSYYNLERVLSFYENLYAAVWRREPLGTLPDMRECMWPIYDPFCTG